MQIRVVRIMKMHINSNTTWKISNMSSSIYSKMWSETEQQNKHKMKVKLTTKWIPDLLFRSTVWKLRNFTLTRKKIRENSIQCNLALNGLISENFCKKSTYVWWEFYAISTLCVVRKKITFFVKMTFEAAKLARKSAMIVTLF